MLWSIARPLRPGHVFEKREKWLSFVLFSACTKATWDR